MYFLRRAGQALALWVLFGGFSIPRSAWALSITAAPSAYSAPPGQTVQVGIHFDIPASEDVLAGTLRIESTANGALSLIVPSASSFTLGNLLSGRNWSMDVLANLVGVSRFPEGGAFSNQVAISGQNPNSPLRGSGLYVTVTLLVPCNAEPGTVYTLSFAGVNFAGDVNGDLYDLVLTNADVPGGNRISNVATVTVSGRPAAFSVTPDAASVSRGDGFSFNSMGAANPTWSVQGVNTNQPAGTISPSGVYTAPSVALDPLSAILVCADAGGSEDGAVVTIPDSTLDVSADRPSLRTDQTLQVTTVVTPDTSTPNLIYDVLDAGGHPTNSLGTVALQGNGRTALFTPNPDIATQVSFSIRVRDTAGGPPPATTAPLTLRPAIQVTANAAPTEFHVGTPSQITGSVTNAAQSIGSGESAAMDFTVQSGGGTLSNATANSVLYTPGSVAAATPVVIRATSHQSAVEGAPKFMDLNLTVHPAVTVAITSPADNAKVTQGASVTIQATAQNALNAQEEALAYTLVSGPGALNGNVYTAPNAASSTPVVIAVTAAGTTQKITLHIVEPPATHHPPVLTVPGGQGVYEGETVSFTVSATDPDEGPVTLSASGLPQGAAFDPSTGAFSFTPDLGQAGAYTLTFTATDSDGEATRKTVALTVNPSPKQGTLTLGNEFALPGGIAALPIIATDGLPNPSGLQFTVNFSQLTPASGTGLELRDVEAGDGLSGGQVVSEIGSEAATVRISGGTPIRTGNPLAILQFKVPAGIAPGTTAAITLSKVVATLGEGAEPSFVAPQAVGGTIRVVMPGDANGDGRVTAADATRFLRLAIGLGALAPDLRVAGDVVPRNADGTVGDGKVTVNDVTRILRMAVGLEPNP